MRKMFLCLLVLLVAGCQISMSKAASESTIWTKQAYTDEFDLPTDKYYISSKQLKGHFSNSVTSESDLTAYIFCDIVSYTGPIKKYTTANFQFTIRLYEYGNMVVSNVFQTDRHYNVSIKTNEGKIISAMGVMRAGSKDVIITDYSDEKRNYHSQIADALLDGGTVYFAISDTSNSLTKYVFSISNANGFDTALLDVFNLDVAYDGSFNIDSDEVDNSISIEVNGTVVKVGTKVSSKIYGQGVVTKIEFENLPYPFTEGASVYIKWENGQTFNYVFPQQAENGQIKILE